MSCNERTLYLNEILVEDGRRIKRRQSLCARLAERDRAYVALLAECDIPYETVTRRDGGLTVKRRGNCPNYPM